MASSDEEGEIVPDYVTNYHFVDYKEEPISFSTLPLRWSEDELLNGLSTQVFLRGSADSGLQHIYKKVIEWKFELSNVFPEIYVLSKDKTWIKLQKPRKSFENTIRTILITVHCLHFMKKNPEASRNAVWNHLLKAFSSYEVEPSEKDLLDHMPLIKKAAVRDKEIAKSEYVAVLLLEVSGKRKSLHEDNRTTQKIKFIVDAADDDDKEDEEEEDDDDKLDGSLLFDSVCALCDNGGELLCCEGRCVRSFHATVDAGAESLCESLGYTEAQVEALPNFLCKNCQYQQHQCFVCGILGSSNTSSILEVFPCVSATCSHFYHPKCVAKLLYPLDEIEAEEAHKKIAAGEPFTCPAHKCYICKRGEDKKVYDLQFAMCRRCPKAYHRKCLPRNIAFEGNADKNIHQRAWDGLLPNRVLIYCMNHNIIPQFGTPERNHILFPEVDAKKKQHRLKLPSGKEKVMAERRRIKLVAENSTLFGGVTQGTAVEMRKKAEEEYGSFRCGNSTKMLEDGPSGQGFGSKVTNVPMKSLRSNNFSVQAKLCKSLTVDKKRSSLGNDHLLPYVVRPKKQEFPSGKIKTTIESTPVIKKVSDTPSSVDAEMEKRIMALINHSTSSFNSEEFIKEHKRLSGNACSSRYVVDKTITMGRVEASVKAIRAALKKLEEGCTIEDAMAVCQPDILREIVRWKEKLKFYLAPFLHGMRYTSFGRHFTKVGKLKEIVDRLHWYVQDGDMIVDFCCGSNDFSWLLKEKLEQMGKSCSFKNYDLIQSKNDFSFEKRDWMTVNLEELPAGSQLIMGLNPPFGHHASRANQFIQKALTFKPKLLILIVPRETKRLDEKKHPYDLIWEDEEMLSGKSFYLPGSVDMHGQQMEQWNLEAPPLYLWSRRDWTAKHQAIAQYHGHLPKQSEEALGKGKEAVSNYLMEESHDCYGDFSNIMNGCGDLSRILDDVPEEDFYGIEHEVAREDEAPRVDGYYYGMHYDGHRNKFSSDDLTKMMDDGIIQRIDQNETSQMRKLGIGEALQMDEMCVDMELSTPTNSPGNYNYGKLGNYNGLESLSEYQPSAPFGNLAELTTGGQGFQVLLPSHSGPPRPEFGMENVAFGTTVPNSVDGGNWQVNEQAGPSRKYNWPSSAHYYHRQE